VPLYIHCRVPVTLSLIVYRTARVLPRRSVSVPLGRVRPTAMPNSNTSCSEYSHHMRFNHSARKYQRIWGKARGKRGKKDITVTAGGSETCSSETHPWPATELALAEVWDKVARKARS
jgi:hypothetical protein